MRIVAVAVGVLACALVGVPLAMAQPFDSPGLGPSQQTLSEKDGRVVLTLSRSTPGRVVYRTKNGSCRNPYNGQPSTCRREARAPDDYEGVEGEVTFTGRGSHEIVIPIVDDDLVEGMEAFEVEAHELTDTGGWAGSSWAIVSIIDDEADCWYPPCPEADGSETAATVTTASPAGTNGASTAAAAAPTPRSAGLPESPVPRTNGPAAPPPPPPSDPESETLLSDLQPGDGFELSSEAQASSSPQPATGDDSPEPSALPVAALAAVVSASGVAWARRRKQW